jgi:hypothetical protein
MEFPMSIKTKLAALAVTAVVAVGAIASTTPANAGGGGWGPGPAVGVGLATGLIVGSAIAASQQPAYVGYPVRRCYWQPQYNVFHQYVGSYKVCNF